MLSGILQILLCYVFMFIQFIILSKFSFTFSFNPCNFRSVLFIFHIPWAFPTTFLLLILSLVLLWLENILCGTWMFSNVLIVLLQSRIWSIVVNILCALEKNEQSCGVARRVLKISIKANWLISLFYVFFLPVFCLIVL